MATAQSVLVLTGSDITRLLRGRESEVLAAVKNAYRAHARRATALPHSTFLRFPDRPSARIIALPAYLGGELPVAGVKWVASFPENTRHGIDRASATILLNDLESGRLYAVLEGALVSAQRTAASAVLATQQLHDDPDIGTVGLIGCGVLNAEILRFLLVSYPGLREVRLFDVSAPRAAEFRDRLRRSWPGRGQLLVTSLQDALAAPVVSFATTATVPHIKTLAGVLPETTVLHISLRDLDPELLLTCNNVVDDIDHACRSRTSLHLAEQLVGHRQFIQGTLGDHLLGRPTSPLRSGKPVVFSPFGLGILDLAVARVVVAHARTASLGREIAGFASRYWSDMAQPGSEQ